MLEKTSQITQSNQQPTPTMPTDHVHQCHIHTVSKHLQGRLLHHLPGQLCHCLTTLSEKKCFLTANLEYPAGCPGLRWTHCSQTCYCAEGSSKCLSYLNFSL